MKPTQRRLYATLPLLGLLAGTSWAEPSDGDRPIQYILVNRVPYHAWHQHRPDTFKAEHFEEIRQAIPVPPGTRIKVGVSFIFSPLRSPDPKQVAKSLERFLELAQQTNTPVLVQFDVDNWWDARPDLWNFWDSSKPGYNPDNRKNVEWTGWDPEQAIKIAWRNWGSQIRVLPPPNLMAPDYRKAWQREMYRLVPIVTRWSRRRLPADQRDLFVGFKVGHETSIGANAWYYPDGNDLLDKPTKDDPVTGLKTDDVCARGVTQIGYAAVRTARIRTTGDITEADLVEVARRHLRDQARIAARLGLPRDRLFTHGVGWKEGELLYGAAVNEYACPGWSFYQHAANPARDTGVQRELAKSDAPYWGAVEWLCQTPRETRPWKRALNKTLAAPRCRLVCIFNWEHIRDSKPILVAIQQVATRSGPVPTTQPQ